MAFDGIVTKAITCELSNLIGARVDKVFEPNKNEVILGLYLDKTNYALDICIDSGRCRINLTTHSKPNPQVAPNFCMLLRKHLIGLRLKNIVTFDLERLIFIDFEGFDEADDIVSKRLVIELMGKHSNVILLDEQNIIVDSLRHIKDCGEVYRDILPHTKYVFPTSNKLSFLEVRNFEDFKLKLNIDKNNLSSFNDLSLCICNTFNGISKGFVNGIINKFFCASLFDDIDLTLCLEKIYNYIKNVIVLIGSNNLFFEDIFDKNGVAKDYLLGFDSSLTDNRQNEKTDFDLNFYIDDFYFAKESSENFKNYRNTLLKFILDFLKKYNKRLYNINEKLIECEDMDKYRIYGELITANLYRIPNKNLSEIELENYYDNNNKIIIKLDKRFLPSYNAKRFFKKYSKLKNALDIVSEQKIDTLRELNYIESVVYELEASSTIQEVYEIYEEISENDIFKFKKSSNKKSKLKKSKLTKNKNVSFNPIKYNVDGYTVLVGRNNKENDYLTLKFANKNDIWFHTKDFHGSHTILKISNNFPYPNQDVIAKAAGLAALHSKAKNSSNVPVDYCEVRFVKKPSGSKPGMVIYSNNKTLYVEPFKI